MPKSRITNLDADTREEIRDAVYDAMRYWPNAHLGDIAPREDMHSAFKIIRSWAVSEGYIQAGIGALNRNVDTYIDM